MLSVKLIIFCIQATFSIFGYFKSSFLYCIHSYLRLTKWWSKLKYDARTSKVLLWIKMNNIVKVEFKHYKYFSFEQEIYDEYEKLLKQ